MDADRDCYVRKGDYDERFYEKNESWVCGGIYPLYDIWSYSLYLAGRNSGSDLQDCSAFDFVLRSPESDFGLKNGGIVTDGFQTIGGIALCVVGLWILIAPASFIKLIPVVVGIVLIYHGIRDIYLCVRMRRADHKWWIGLITAAVTAVLGIVLIRCAFLAMEMGMVILGIF